MKSQAARICVAGYSIFQEAVVAALQSAGVEVACIASHSPDPPQKTKVSNMLAARGFSERLSDVARRADVEYLMFTDMNSEAAVSAIKASGATVVLSCSAPILRPSFLGAFAGAVFNLHGSLHFRGRAAWSWLILSGQTTDSVVLHWVDNGIDTGGHIEESDFTWGSKAYPIDVAHAQRKSIVGLVATFARCALSNDFPEGRVSPSRPYYPGLNTKLDSWIDWSWSAQDIERMIRAFGWPYDGASAVVELPSRHSTRVAIARAEVVEGARALHPLMIGCVVGWKSQGWVDVQCGHGILRIASLRDKMDERPAANVIRLGSRLRSSANKGTLA